MPKTLLLVALASLLALGSQSFAELSTVDAVMAANLMLPYTPVVTGGDDTPSTLRIALPWNRIVWGLIVIMSLGGATATVLLSVIVLHITLEVLNKSSPLLREYASRFGGLQGVLRPMIGDISHAHCKALKDGQVWRARWLIIASIPAIITNVSRLAVIAVRDRLPGELRIEVS